MEKIDFQYAIGKRINRDIFSDRGVLLLSSSMIITNEHVQLLEKHKIILVSQDVTPVGPYIEASPQYSKFMDEIVQTVRQIFEEIRETRNIPLASLRKDVIPMIYEVTNEESLFSLFATLQAKDDYTYRHNIAVGSISTLIGTWMGLEQKELLQLTTAALLHDVGKMLIPQDLLNKPSKLTKEEFALIKNHTVLGYEIIKETIGTSHRVALVALQHHERMDGNGYPFGIKKEKIDLFSRIVSVADVFHAMTSKRSYRDPSPFYEVLFQMEKDTFGSLDPTITRLFIRKMMDCLIGSKIILTDGREGKIILVPTHDPTHPLIQVGNEFVDLSRDLSIRINKIL